MDLATRKQNSIFGIAFGDKTRKVLSIIFKVLGVLLGVVYLWGTLSNQYYERSIYTVMEMAPNLSGRVLIEFIKFFTNASILIGITAPFFYFRSTDKIVRYGTPIIILLRLILCSNLLQLAVGPSGKNSYFLIQQFFIEIGLLAAISIFAWVMFLFEGRERSTKKDILRTSGLAVLVYILIGICNIPYSFLVGTVGTANARALDFSFAHRLIIYSTFVVPFAFMMLFRNKTYHIRWYICLQLALSAFFFYFRDSTFESFTDPATLPLHLCNTGVIIMLIAFIFKNKPAFYFAYLINILGAYFATFMPDKMGDIFYFDSLHFWHNHLADIMIPMLAVGLKVFDRPKLKFILYAVLGFSVYFVLVAYLDAKYYYKGVDYFFLNSDKFTSYITQLNFLRTDFIIRIPISGGNQELRILWLYWILIYIGYVGLTFAMWFAYSLVYRISDSHIDCHNKIAEKKKLAKQRKLYLEQQKGGEQK